MAAMTLPLPGPGFLAISVAPWTKSPDLAAAERALGGVIHRQIRGTLTILRNANPAVDQAAADHTVDLLSLAPRRHEHAVSLAEVGTLLGSRDPGRLRDVLPPFAAVSVDRAGNLVAAADVLGYRHLYLRSGNGWAAIATSARALAACAPTKVDRSGLALQSLLGWQVGTGTPFAEVRKLEPGAIVTLDAGRITIDAPEPRRPETRCDIGVAVLEAAAMLREHVAAVLDDHPDIMLQLTGGQDSRLLLGAIEPARRAGLSAMTLASPGNPDATIAADLAWRYGMSHQVIDLGGLESVTPEQAHTLAVAAARRLDCSANPIAVASVAWAESRAEQRPRLAGLGGEVARGFYYFGPMRDVPVTRERVRRLADWRMFTNESADRTTLDERFAERAHEDAVEALYVAFASRGRTWPTATDEFYLLERMHRWSGVVASTTVQERITINPMLDDRFLTIARGLAPRAKNGSLFLGQLSCALDRELSSIPLEGRPAPEVYANPTIANRALLGLHTAHKVSRKVRQRIARQGRPPVGAAVLAPKVAAHYREDPHALDGIRELEVFRPEWLDCLTHGTAILDPGTAALLVNLEVVADAIGR